MSIKFGVTFGDVQKNAIEEAAELLNVTMSEIVRIGSYRFAQMVIHGGIDEGILEQLKGTDIN